MLGKNVCLHTVVNNLSVRDFLPSPVSIKTKDLTEFSKTRQKPYAISGAQKNPRRELILTGIYANYSKLKYGAFSFPSTMLNIFLPNRLKTGRN